MKKNNLITFVIIIAIIIFAFFAINKSSPETTEEIAKCIGENSVLYTQLGCSHCEEQEEMFGDHLQYLNVIDCFYERDKCDEIIATPTWIIDGEKYEGVQTIEKLQELTGCE